MTDSASRRAADALSDAWHFVDSARAAVREAMGLCGAAVAEGDAIAHGDPWDEVRIRAGIALEQLGRAADRLCMVGAEAAEYADAYEASAREEA